MVTDLIYDVGMNNGDDTAYYLHSGYRVVAIEADPTLAQAAAARFPDAISDGRLTILNVAIAERAGMMPFYINPAQEGWNSLSRELTTRDGTPAEVIEVPCVTLGSVLDEYGVPYYLKIDIEYADHFCLDALAGRADLPRYLSFEAGPEVVQRMPLLHTVGYDQFKLLAQPSFLPVQPEPFPQQRRAAWMMNMRRFFRSKSLASRASYRLGGGRLAEDILQDFQTAGDGWRFSEMSSGPFGEDTRGVWQPYDRAMQIMADVAGALAAGKQYGIFDTAILGWIDVHARLRTDHDGASDRPRSDEHDQPELTVNWPSTVGLDLRQ